MPGSHAVSGIRNGGARDCSAPVLIGELREPGYFTLPICY